MNSVGGTADSLRDVVVRAWRRTLEADPVSDEENFFEAGGNSILLVHFQRELSKGLGYKVPLQKIFHAPTVAALVNQVSAPAVGDRAAPGPPPRTGPLRLYCVPYAGCSARIYDTWQTRLPDTVEVVPLELPGRGSRCTQPPVSVLPDLLEDLSAAMDTASETEYAVFGHSFGAVIAYELVRHASARGLPAARFLAVSGSRAPHLSVPGERVGDMSDEALRRKLRALRGTPEELLENEELMAMYLPVIRADYAILDDYRAAEPGRVDCHILALYGDADSDADKDSVLPWSSYTRGRFTIEPIAGDHFFLHAAETEVVGALRRHLGDTR
ncbi:alpha/beta fold hydrolase [Streptomyces albus]|uniref:alpha/beta fold hydrolase n=1 Tax=Streptomyces albus TaxID=1888 RepID=UPI0033C81B5C